MTTLDALQVDGIRSYFPNDKQTIKFLKPLTLILGSNGCGKTTIIEALRMATTGALPPNAGHGSSFIHDSKMSQATEVKAQIKLRFNSASGKAMTVSRQFQTTVRKQANAKPEYKQLEANIKDQSTSKTTSHRCADIDKIIPELMGVSKAVLENVIFCHQEDANWVLSEPKVLKDKFDAIFSSTRYSKALDNIKKLQKEQTDQIKMWRVDEKELSMLKEQARSHRINRDSNDDEVQRMRGQVKKIDEDIKVRKKILMRCDEALQQHAEIEAEQGKLTTQLQYLEEGRLKLLEKVDQEELEEAQVDQLVKLQQTILQLIRGEDDNKAQFQREVGEKEAELSRLAHHVDRLNKEESMLQAEQARIMVRQGEWKALAKELSEKHGLGIAADALTLDEYPSNVSAKMKRAREDKEQKWQELRAKHNKERDKLNADMAQMDTKIRMNEEGVRAKTDEIGRLKVSLQRLRAEVAQIDEALKGKSLDDKRVQLAAAQAELERAQQDAGYLQREKTLRDLGAREEELRGAVRGLRERFKLLNQQQARRVIKAQKEKELRDLDESITASFAEIEYAVQTALGRIPALGELREKVGTHVGACERRHAELAERQRRREQQRVQVESQRDQINSLLRQQKKEYNDLERATNNLTVDGATIDVGEETWEEAQGEGGDKSRAMKKAIEKHREDIEDRKKGVDSLQGYVELMDKYMMQAKSHKCCPLCDQKFEGGAVGLEKFVQKLKKLQAADPNKQEEQEEIVAVMGRELRVLEDALVKIELASNIQQQMKTQEDELLALDMQLAEYEVPSEDVLQLQKAKEDLQEAQRLRAAVQDLRLSELARLKEEVAALRADGDADGNVEEVEKELERKDAELETVGKDAAKLKKSVEDHKQDMQAQYESLNTMREEFVRMEHHTQTRADKQKQIDAEEASRGQKEQELQELKDCRVPNSAKKDQLRDALAAMHVAHERDMQTLDRDLQETKQECAGVEAIEREVHAHRQQGKEEMLARKVRDKKEAEGKWREVKRAKDALEERRRAALQGLDSHKEDLAKTNDLIELLHLMEKMKTAQETLEERRQALNNLPPKPDVESERKTQEKEVQRCEKNKHEKAGSISTLMDNIAKHDAELKQAKYKGVEQKHKQMTIKLVAMEASNKDLAKYSSALDKALMRFHEMKMEEINKIIKEYWQTTYKGTDIDTIEIKADVDTTANRRSHNYRLIMHTRSGNAQLDMRGRCSAGQKVLASLVVRMALAETFCHNCGILALDEPTSNLDHHNIDGFTEALSRIVIERGRDNAGFQLVVISHDDGFIDSLARATSAPKFYRVAKDKDTQASKITVHEVSQLD